MFCFNFGPLRTSTVCVCPRTEEKQAMPATEMLASCKSFSSSIKRPAQRSESCFAFPGRCAYRVVRVRCFLSPQWYWYVQQTVDQKGMINVEPESSFHLKAHYPFYGRSGRRNCWRAFDLVKGETI